MGSNPIPRTRTRGYRLNSRFFPECELGCYPFGRKCVSFLLLYIRFQSLENDNRLKMANFFKLLISFEMKKSDSMSIKLFFADFFGACSLPCFMFYSTLLTNSTPCYMKCQTFFNTKISKVKTFSVKGEILCPKSFQNQY